jgi:hypothetical protein
VANQQRSHDVFGLSALKLAGDRFFIRQRTDPDDLEAGGGGYDFDQFAGGMRAAGYGHAAVLKLKWRGGVRMGTGSGGRNAAEKQERVGDRKNRLGVHNPPFDIPVFPFAIRSELVTEMLAF